MAKDTKFKAMVDRISELPDELLTRILSFLPPIFAHTTSVLSKRWKPLCKFMVVLHFDDKLVKGEEEFQCFRRCVDKVMLSPDMNNQPIRAFHLNCCHPELLLFNHDQWIEAAKLRGVEDLQLSLFHFYTAFEIYMSHSNSLVDDFISVAPNNIFSCRTLVILKLERLCMAGNILSVDLPSLKTLHLKSVYLQNSDDLKKLISKSLVLEDLYIMVGYKESASIPLTRVGNGPYHVFFKAIHYNVQFLQLEVRLPNENIISYFKGSPIFQNLIHLKLMFVHFYGWNDLMDVLQNCPNLEILLIDEIFPKYAQNGFHECSWALSISSTSLTNWKCPNSVPECISSHLRSCTISYDGMPDSLRFAKYILQNARCLQVMTVKSKKSTDSVYHREKLDKLNFCPTISPFCKLSVGLF
ncbi:FBD-associated F-box protein At4g10400-like [Vicia villosa]|uniref:FBD-associated F-box protein At4g10400-like n=1 Tax=Vicia villosa TaxID=3911 RepID=UPI00273BB8A5|nr:FBD-associated F-box protein At4g10400-like [Vicia villosa]